VRDLASHCGQQGLIVLFLAYTGVRFGEMAALRVGRLDLLRRRAIIAESVTEVHGAQVWSTPKGHERREVPIPRFLVDQLAVYVAGKSTADLVFTSPRGGALRAGVFRRDVFDRAAESVGMDGLHPHELRHTAASLAIASGANVKVVQQMLGHKSATMTLDSTGTCLPTSWTRSPTPWTVPRALLLLPQCCPRPTLWILPVGVRTLQPCKYGTCRWRPRPDLNRRPPP